jgi:hypothetical protein
VSYNGANSSSGGKALNIIRVDNPTGTPTFTYQQLNVGAIDASSPYNSFTAPQPGTSTPLAASDNRIQDVVWRNGFLYATTTIIPTSGADAGNTTAHWFKIDTSNLGSLALADQGNVSGASIGSGVRTFDPSIAVDANNDFAISFSASGPSLYAGAYYTVHPAGSPAGTLDTAAALATGQATYVRTYGGPDRWGDYSSISVNPVDNSTFFVFNEYAQTQGTTFAGESGRWGTEVGAFNLTGSPIPTSPIVAGSQGGTISGSTTTPTTSASTGPSGASLTLDSRFHLLVNAMASFENGSAITGEWGGNNPNNISSELHTLTTPLHQHLS